MSAHYFFALSLPSDVKQVITDDLEPLRKESAFKSWVHTEDYHITLAFLGAAEEEQLLHAETAIQNRLNSSPFPLEILKYKTFGKADSPRIFWRDVTKPSELMTIQNIVYESCKEAGFKLESRPFTPHITVARKWNKDVPYSDDWIQSFETKDKIPFNASEVVLYQTHLDQKPKYEKKRQIPLVQA